MVNLLYFVAFLTRVFHICLNEYSRVDNYFRIFNKVSEQGFQQIKARAKNYCNGRRCQHFVTEVETAKSTHNKLKLVVAVYLSISLL